MREYDYRIWEKLPFTGFDREVLDEKKRGWCEYAQKILEEIENKNVALIADTSAGKTVIAALSILASDYKTLFLAPTRNLCDQHQELFQKITGGMNTKVITGLTSSKKKIWNDDCKVIFSTPHMALQDIKKGVLELNNFNLIIIDEFHKTAGDYPYTKITKQSQSRILALSASPGDSQERINQLERDCRIEAWIVAEIDTPRKIKNLVTAEADEAILTVSKHFDSMLKKVLKEINDLLPNLKIDPGKKHLFSFKESKEWEESIGNLSKEWERRSAKFLIAKYIKLYHSYNTIIGEGYASFLDYTEKLKKQKSKSADNILAEKDFLKIVRIAKKEINNHPKALMLLKILHQWLDLKKNAVVFVNQRATGEYLKSLLNLHFIKTENIFGGGGKVNLKKQQKALSDIAEGNLNVLVSTSVIEEGISVPEVDMIINYSPSSTGVSSKQRNGRTARLKKGNIVNLILKHPLDEISHWSGQAKVKKGEKSLQRHLEKKKNQIQLSLFPEEEI